MVTSYTVRLASAIPVRGAPVSMSAIELRPALRAAYS
jgi:hypothetical protein